MIQTMANVRSDVLIPGSSRLPVPADHEFRNINGFPPPSCSSSSSSSVLQQSQQRSAPVELLYTHDLRRALDKSDFGTGPHRRAHLQNPRSRDRIDERHDETVTRLLRHGEHLTNACRQSDCHPPPPPPTSRQPPFGHSQHHKRNDACWNSSDGHDGSNGVGTLLSDRGDVTVTPAAAAAYPGDDNLEVDEDDEDSVSPPKITPIGGRILTTIDNPIVKPIPFKPIPSSSSTSVYEVPTRKGSSQNSSLDRVAKTTASHQSAADDGYASREWQNLSSSSSVSQNSSFPDADSVDRRSAKSSSGDGGGDGGGDSASYRKRLNSDHAGGGGGVGTDAAGERGRCCEQGSGSSSSASSSSRRRRRRGFAADTPSPSDSGVGELEAMLREKELEIRALRGTMERNETAMMEVFEERRQNWEMEMGDAVHEWQLKLRGQQQKSFRTEQSLLLQIFKLQQENKDLRQKNLDRRTANKEPVEDEDDDADLRTKIEGLVLELRQMTMDIDVLKSQLKNAVDEASNRSMELVSAQLALKDNEIEIDCKNGEIHRLLTTVNHLKQDLSRTNEQKLGLEYRIEKYESNPDSRSSSFDGLGLVESVKVDLSVAQKELEELRATLEQERSQWVDEKTKVINYQKHLQLNYVQMARKNKLLEIEVQQMTSELERHDTECLRVTTTDESFC